MSDQEAAEQVCELFNRLQAAGTWVIPFSLSDGSVIVSVGDEELWAPSGPGTEWTVRG